MTRPWPWASRAQLASAIGITPARTYKQKCRRNTVPRIHKDPVATWDWLTANFALSSAVRRREVDLMAAQVLDARQIFLEAVEKHAPSHWPAFLDAACGNDAALR